VPTTRQQNNSAQQNKSSRKSDPPPAPTFEIENELRAAGARVVAGVDEVGRGAWAGPLLVCAAVPGEGEPPAGLTDSKRLTPKRRRELATQIEPWVADHAFGWSEAAEIDEVGMTEALHRAARRALDALEPRPDAVLLDGRHDLVGGAEDVGVVEADGAYAGEAAQGSGGLEAVHVAEFGDAQGQFAVAAAAGRRNNEEMAETSTSGLDTDVRWRMEAFMIRKRNGIPPASPQAEFIRSRNGCGFGPG
jgi:hypothetical protein